ncbi:uncharacterized protein LOC124366511 [Homalodisca vitripennis]|uniref:uncharacterized protein LOC124366511 n=1 Tax=Homalodisca vitripennis TaxID=197043 RepID=UPI001EEBB8D6|nr:uncharacterized protein LOC124366511 [Homalodisca vitripennis]
MSKTKIVFLFFTLLSAVLAENSTVISRKRRYLNFPNKATVVMSFSLLKGIARDYRVGPTTNVITFHELDVLFPLPHDPSPLDLTQTALGQPPIFQNAISRHRRDVFRQLEDVLYLHGVDGRTCILKALCEARQTVPQEVENLMLDLLLVLFRQSENAERDDDTRYHVSEGECKTFIKNCPLSVFDMAMDWAEQYYNEMRIKSI